MTRCDEIHLLNRIIDRTLLAGDPAQRQALLALATSQNLQPLAERLRRRATRLGRRKRQQNTVILARRDELLMALYATHSPPAWANAWCDGSSRKDNAHHRAGIGVLILAASGKCLASISQKVGDLSPFEAEIAALVTVLDQATALELNRLRIHTDCKALAQLWCEQRDDPRLAATRPYLSRFRRLEIRTIPRLHNPTAHALAKLALRNQAQAGHMGSRLRHGTGEAGQEKCVQEKPGDDSAGI